MTPIEVSDADRDKLKQIVSDFVVKRWAATLAARSNASMSGNATIGKDCRDRSEPVVRPGARPPHTAIGAPPRQGGAPVFFRLTRPRDRLASAGMPEDGSGMLERITPNARVDIPPGGLDRRRRPADSGDHGHARRAQPQIPQCDHERRGTKISGYVFAAGTTWAYSYCLLHPGEYPHRRALQLHAAVALRRSGHGRGRPAAHL